MKMFNNFWKSFFRHHCERAKKVFILWSLSISVEAFTLSQWSHLHLVTSGSSQSWLVRCHCEIIMCSTSGGALISWDCLKRIKRGKSSSSKGGRGKKVTTPSSERPGQRLCYEFANIPISVVGGKAKLIQISSLSLNGTSKEALKTTKIDSRSFHIFTWGLLIVAGQA